MKNYKIIFLALGVALFSASCLVDDEDETLEAFSNTPYAIGFRDTTANFSYFENLGAVPNPLSLDVLGGGNGTGVTSNTTVQFEVVEDLTTATAGVEYTLEEDGSLVIPAGEEFGTLNLSVNTGQLNPTTPTQLVLEITSVSQGSTIITARDRIYISFVGCQSNVDQFSYQVTTTNASGAVVYSAIENITVPQGAAPNNFRTTSTGYFGPSGTNIVPPAQYNGFNFVDICGDITISSQNLGGVYSNQVFGSGSVDPATGNITFNYQVTFASGNGVYTSVYVKL